MSSLETYSEKGCKDHEPGLLPRGSVGTYTRTTGGWGLVDPRESASQGGGGGSECGQHMHSVIFLLTSSWTQLVLPAL